jgi:hypothetical protein
MIYVQLYNERKGMNPRMQDGEFTGPALGPLTAITWSKGELFLHYAERKLAMQHTEHGDHIRYGGGLYNSLRVLTHDQLYETNILFCGPANAVHSIDMIEILINA